MQTTILDAAVTLDTTVASTSGLGTETGLLLANRGDTLDTRVVIRFDTLPDKFVPTGDTSQAIKTVDSAYIQLTLDTTRIKATDPVTIEAYDVDTTASDTSTSAILALFRPDRFISSQTFTRAQLTDTLKYFIDNATVLSKLQSGSRLRLGLRATGPSSSQLTFASSEGGFPPFLFFRATPDTATKPLQVFPRSTTPADEPLIAQRLVDYTVVAKGLPPAPPTVLAVGGLPARRIYVRFDIPSKLIDSSTIVRATLLLNQIANPTIDPGDTIKVIPQVVLAGTAVTDPTKAAQIIANISADTLRLTAGHAGSVDVELAPAFTLWRTQKPDTLPRAIVMKSVAEGTSPIELRFSSSEDIAALRPRLRISYTNRVPLGLP
ncbi:MAG TPA: hypothetical protein VJ840_17515 [Gemmatimonadaceae bacterium]|nr:hypothetical protein [Gemmatimonadaceae bacterium]